MVTQFYNYFIQYIFSKLTNSHYINIIIKILKNIRFSIKHSKLVNIMTSITFDKISEDKTTGALFNVYFYTPGKNNSKKPIFLNIPSTKSIFGIETRYNNNYFKWTISSDIINNISLLENMLINSFTELAISSIKSKIIVKKGYPTMLETKLNKSASSSDIILHKPGEILTYNSLKNKKCTVKLQLRNISIQTRNNEHILYYNLEINEIALLHDK